MIYIKKYFIFIISILKFLNINLTKFSILKIFKLKKKDLILN